MAGPIFSFVGGAVAGSTLSHIVGPIVGVAFGPLTAAVDVIAQKEQQAANYKDPVLLPPIGSCIDAYVKGLATETGLEGALWRHGAYWVRGRPHPKDKIRPYMWRAVVEAARACPDVGALNQLYVRERIDLDTWRRLGQRAGADLDLWEPVLAGYYATPGPAELILARRRELIDDGAFAEGLTRQGIAEAHWRRVYQDLLAEIPPISDLLRFSHKEAFAPELASALGFFDEYPEAAEPWVRKHGYTGGPGFEILRDGRRVKATWLDLYNAAEWQPISPTQSYEMFHRLRPGRVERYNRVLSEGLGEPVEMLPFLLPDVKAWLRIADYPKSVRNQLTAITYGVLRLTDIRSAFLKHIRDRAWAIDQLRDRHLHPDDAADVVDLWERDRELGALAPVKAFGRGAVVAGLKELVAGYADGVIDRDTARVELVGAGVPEAQALVILETADLRRRRQHARAVQAAVKRAYLAGSMAATEARGRLAQAGITDARAAELLDLWSLARDRLHRELTTAKVQDLHERGLIPYDEALRRLVTLGWEQPDALLLLAEARQQIDQRQARIISQSEQRSRQRASQLEGELRRLEAQRRQLQADLRRESPVSLLVRLLRMGRLSEGYVRRRMSAMGLSAEAIELHLAAARPERNGQQGEENGEERPPEESETGAPGGTGP